MKRERERERENSSRVGPRSGRIEEGADEGAMTVEEGRNTN